MINPKHLSFIRDVLYNTHPKSGSTVDYARGCVVGVVSTLMAYTNNFKMAFDIMIINLPACYRKECIPECWSINPLQKSKKGWSNE